MMLTEEMTTRDPIRQIAEEIRLRLAEVAEGKGQGSVDDGGLGSKGGMADFFFCKSDPNLAIHSV